MNRTVHISDIAILNQQTYKKGEFPRQIKYLDTGNLTRNKIDELQCLDTRIDKVPSRAQRRVYKKTILYSTVRPNQEHFGFIENDIENLVVSTGFTTIDVNDKNTYPKYIYYLITQPYIIRYLHTIAENSVSSYPSISPSDIGGLKFKIPSFEKQQEIASILSSLDTKIELNNKINAELEAMAKTLYDYWFVQFDFPISAEQAAAMGKPNLQGKPYKSSGGKMVYNPELKREIPEGWGVNELGDFIEIQRGISYKSSEINGSGIPMINLNSFNLDGTYKAQGVKSFSGRYSNNHLAKSGDLLIAATDVTRSADIIGRAILVPNYYDGEIVFSMDIAKIIPKKNLTKSYLMFLFNSQHYHDYIKWYASGTLVLHLNMNGMNWYKTEIPPLSLIKKFESFYSPIAQRISETQKQNQQLTELRDWLLPMLMNGQVTLRQAQGKPDDLDMAAEPKGEYGK